MNQAIETARSSLLFEDPKTYLYWWTVVPLLPESSNDQQYRVLKRLWADHTMNCLSNKNGAWKLASSRGFYVQKREDCITPVLFQIWAAFPDCTWVGSLLDLWDVPHGTIRRARWSYSWEQKRDKSRRPDIIDIVLNWEDEQGQAVVAIEVKRRGGQLSDKDLNGGTGYLQLPSIIPFERKWVAFLLADADVDAARKKLPPGTLIAPWEAMGELQMAHASRLATSDDVRGLIGSYIAKHYSDLGMPLKLHSVIPDSDGFDGSHVRYDAVRAMNLASSIERFLLGSEAVFCARAGRMPDAPFEWLAKEPSFIDVVVSKSQTTSDREQPHWRLITTAPCGN
jgi:hypothetical protein